MSNSSTWSPEKLDAFGREISEIGTLVKAKLGADDLQHLKKVKTLSRLSEFIGRTLIHVSIDPVTWATGVFALWLHLQLEATEIGHSALHGCWDDIEGAEAYHSKKFQWKTPIDEESWKHEHNVLHHQYTNIMGRDPDLNYGGMRPDEKTPWMPHHLTQVTQFFITAPLFLWVIGTYTTGLTDLVHPKDSKYYAHILPDRKIKTILKSFRRTAKKAIPYSLIEFGFWPLLAGPFWWKVLAANVSADVMRNIYSAATIYAGHFSEDLECFDVDFKPKGKGGWFKSQIEAAHNFKVPHLVSLLCGGLDYQIEHHLFPKLPPNRLREIAPMVQKVCEKYELPYQVSSWGNNLNKALKKISRLSISGKVKEKLIGQLS